MSDASLGLCLLFYIIDGPLNIYVLIYLSHFGGGRLSMGFALCWETWVGTIAFFFGSCDILGFSRIGLDWRWGMGGILSSMIVLLGYIL